MNSSNDQPLRLTGLSVTRRAGATEIPVLAHINLTVEPGQWVVLLGANGSGKTSLLKYLASADSPWAEHAAIMFQDPDEQLISATVEQELASAGFCGDLSEQLETVGLAGTEKLDPRILSAGQKQRLLLAVALAGEPGLLLCDEPTALQDQEQATWMLQQLDQWRREPGRRLITATQDLREARRADHLVVLDAGRIVVQGASVDLLDHALVRNLLAPLTVSPLPVRDVAASEPLAVLDQVGCVFAPGHGFAGVDLEIRPGDRVGIVGANGCGKSTLLAACCGARRPDTGRIDLLSRPLYGKQTCNLKHGAALLAPQFAEYLFSRSTVAEEIAADPVLAERPGEQVLAAMDLTPDLLDRHPHSLSTGQRRRLALALVLLSGRPLLLLDEPSAALDRSARQAVLRLLALAPPTSALVIASHDEALLDAAGCKVYLLHNNGLSAS